MLSEVLKVGEWIVNALKHRHANQQTLAHEAQKYQIERHLDAQASRTATRMALVPDERIAQRSACQPARFSR